VLCDLRDVGWEPAVVVWCPPVAKGQQLLVKVPPPAHLHYGFRGPFCQGPRMTLPGDCQPPWQSAIARLSLVEFARVLRAAGKTATNVLCQAHLP
jgi:hypothetical protein